MTPHNWEFEMYNSTTSVRQLLTIVSLIPPSCLVQASPKIEFVAMAAPDVVELVVQEGRVNVGRQVPYVKQEADVIRQQGHRRYLHRDGKKIGVLVGVDGDILRPFDTFAGEPLDTKDFRPQILSSAQRDRTGSALHGFQTPASVSS